MLALFSVFSVICKSVTESWIIPSLDFKPYKTSLVAGENCGKNELEWSGFKLWSDWPKGFRFIMVQMLSSMGSTVAWLAWVIFPSFDSPFQWLLYHSVWTAVIGEWGEMMSLPESHRLHIHVNRNNLQRWIFPHDTLSVRVSDIFIEKN